MTLKTRPCDAAHARARLQIARAFFDASDTLDGLDEGADPYRGNALVTNYVHSGIAASDAICCTELGEHAHGQHHHEATALLRKVPRDGRELAGALGTLLSLKTDAGYGTRPMTAEKVRRAQRAADKLLRSARDRVL